ncbi:hypothetical protein EBR21_02175, partial [bacterium]|nr:hypothetical protein [bacterium]
MFVRFWLGDGRAVAESAAAGRDFKWTQCTCILFAAGVLWTGLITNDFSISYVFRNSAADMPPIYLLTAFWSSLEGSHLLWTMIMSIVVSISLLTLREKNEPILPGLLAAYGFCLSFMTLLLVWASAPLSRL